MKVQKKHTLSLQKEVLMKQKYTGFTRLFLTAALSASAVFFSGCAQSVGSPSHSAEPLAEASAAASAPAMSSFVKEDSAPYPFKKYIPVSIAAALKNRKDPNAANGEERIAGFSWFYDGYIEKGQSMNTMPDGAEKITDISELNGTWHVTHFRHPNDDWQKQLLEAELKTDGKEVTYTETWQYIVYKDGSVEDARTAAHDLPYSGTMNSGSLTMSLIEKDFNNKLNYISFYKYRGVLYAVGTYDSDFDGDHGYAAMYKEATSDVSSAKPEVIAKKPEAAHSAARQEVIEIPETVPAPTGLEFAEGTWKSSDHYFTIRFLDDGRLNYIRYGLEALGDESGFGGMDAHTMRSTCCDYSFDSAKGELSFASKDDPKKSVVVSKGSGDSLTIRSDANGIQKESSAARSEAPTVMIPEKN